MSTLLQEIDALPHVEGGLAVTVLADEMSDGFCLIRTDTDSSLDVAIVYDGSDRGLGEAEGYARILSGAPPMLDLLTSVREKWGTAVIEDEPIDGGDAVACLSEFTIAVRDTLQAMVEPLVLESGQSEPDRPIHDVAAGPAKRAASDDRNPRGGNGHSSPPDALCLFCGGREMLAIADIWTDGNSFWTHVVRSAWSRCRPTCKTTWHRDGICCVIWVRRTVSGRRRRHNGRRPSGLNLTLGALS